MTNKEKADQIEKVFKDYIYSPIPTKGPTVQQCLIEIAQWKDSQYMEKINKLYSIIDSLWTALDNIDTYADLKIDDTDEKNPFRVICDKAAKRFEHVQSDGYDLFIGGVKITKQDKTKWTETIF